MRPRAGTGRSRAGRAGTGPRDETAPPPRAARVTSPPRVGSAATPPPAPAVARPRPRRRPANPRDAPRLRPAPARRELPSEGGRRPLAARRRPPPTFPLSGTSDGADPQPAPQGPEEGARGGGWLRPPQSNSPLLLPQRKLDGTGCPTSRRALCPPPPPPNMAAPTSGSEHSVHTSQRGGIFSLLPSPSTLTVCRASLQGPRRDGYLAAGEQQAALPGRHQGPQPSASLCHQPCHRPKAPASEATRTQGDAHEPLAAWDVNPAQPGAIYPRGL